MVPASDILEYNPNRPVIHFLCDWAVEADDCELFPLVAPPPSRADTEQRPIRTDSSLCEVRRRSLEHFAYVVEEAKSKRLAGMDLALAEVVIHHNDLTSLFNVGLFAYCHLCYLLSGFIKGPGHPAGSAESQEFYSETRIELAWDSHFAMLDGNQENFKRGRLQFAETMPSRGRTQVNYYTFARLQLWSATDFHHLFVMPVDLEAASLASDGLGDDVSHTDEYTAADGSESDSSTASILRHNIDRAFMSPANSERASLASDGLCDGIGTTDHPTVAHSSRPASSTTSSPRHEESDSCSVGLRRLEESNTGSYLSQRLTIHWLSKCQNNKNGDHSDCNEQGGTWLPTRLIDVKHAIQTSVLRLVSPEKAPEAFASDRRYITLSHCWGQWGPTGIPSLKMANEDDRFQKGIDLEQVPPTFQHAIEVSGWFGGQSTLLPPDHEVSAKST